MSELFVSAAMGMHNALRLISIIKLTQRESTFQFFQKKEKEKKEEQIFLLKYT